MDIISFKRELQPYLEAFLAEQISRARQRAGSALVEEALSHAARITLSGGKRMRPYIAFLSYESFGGRDRERMLRASVALEVFHAFALIHDDIIDRGSLRHGVETTHGHLSRFMEVSGRKGDLARVADSQAMLVGDLFAAWAARALDQGWESGVNQDAAELFGAMADDVLLGEMLDVDVTTREHVSLGAIERKTELKTAWYSVVHPIKMGALLAGEFEAGSGFAEGFGVPLGMAFQHQDDLLDVFGAASTGKSQMREVENGQHTLLTHYVASVAAPRFAREWERIRRGGTVAQPRLRWLFRESGAAAFARQEIGRLFDEAEDAISRSRLREGSKEEWRNLVEYIRHREV